MANRKIPQDAFSFYFSLGPVRSYEKVATRYGVTKRAVVMLAVRERWQEQALEIERKARERTNAKAGETTEEMNERHLKLMRVIQGKALEALKQFPLETALAAVRALEGSVSRERSIRGEPSSGASGSVEEIIKREYERWMTPVEDGAPEGGAETLPLEGPPGN